MWIYAHLFIYSTVEEHWSCLHCSVIEFCCYNYVNFVGDTVINHLGPFLATCVHKYFHETAYSYFRGTWTEPWTASVAGTSSLSKYNETLSHSGYTPTTDLGLNVSPCRLPLLHCHGVSVVGDQMTLASGSVFCCMDSFVAKPVLSYLNH